MKKRKTIAIIVIIISLIALLGAVGFLIFKTLNTKHTDDEYKKLASSYASNIDVTDPTEAQPATDASGSTVSPATKPTKKSGDGEQPVNNPVDLNSLSQQNTDVYSWLYVPDTNINYPVAQSDGDDNYYLHRDVYGNYSFAGAIYSQKCNKRDYSDRVTVLYGHNMLDGSMFATLHRFEDPDFFSSHKYFYIFTKDRRLTYEVVSAFVYDDRHIMNSFDFTNDEVFKNWLEDSKNPHSINANVNESVKLDLNSKLVVLSTCNDNDVGRYLVEGVLINDEPTE